MTETNSTKDSTLMANVDDEVFEEPGVTKPCRRQLEAGTQDSWYETDLDTDHRQHRNIPNKPASGNIISGYTEALEKMLDKELVLNLEGLLKQLEEPDAPKPRGR